MRIAKFEKQLCVSLSPDTYQAIREMSDAQRESMAEVVRQLIDDSLSQHNQLLSTSKKKEGKRC